MGRHRSRARRSIRIVAGLSGIAVALTALPGVAEANAPDRRFDRVATFSVTANAGSSTAEIVTATKDGSTLIYTDAGAALIGFVDIRRPDRPTAAGTLAVGGSPTSVAVVKNLALVAVDDTPVDADDSYGPHAGRLVVVDITARTIVRTIDLLGQPDSVKVSPDGTHAVVAIENQRDETVADGVMPHIPANGAERDEPGFVSIVSLTGPVNGWAVRTVPLVGLPGMRFPEDPEPEFVDINDRNQAAVTLQENNHVVLIDVRRATVITHWSAGSVSGQPADTSESPSEISFTGQISVPREPDAVVFSGNHRLFTADEGDYDGGSRSFTLFDTDGKVLAASGASLELEAVRHGHYNEERSANKGVEPEGLAAGRFKGDDLLFVALERANAVAVYETNWGKAPRFVQLLPTGVEPEGLLALPGRDLFVAASEGDGTLSIYAYDRRTPQYPALVSDLSTTDGAVPGVSSPIPWGALSSLAADPQKPGILYTVHDNVYDNSRIYKVDARSAPARIVDAVDLTGGSNESWDLEGISIRPAQAGGGFWLASEGSAAAAAAPGVRLNHLVATTANGVVTREVPLPPIAGATPTSNGFEGVAAIWNPTLGREEVYVAIQRSWDGTGFTRIGRYLPATDEWSFVAYPLDAGSNVGLSELVSVGPNEFAVIERDNRGGSLAVVKRIYRFSVAGLAFTPITDPADPPLVTKTLVEDLLPVLASPRGQIIEKVEGLAVDAAGETFLNTDNDGEDGESQFFRLGRWSKLVR